jgi:hypothetical protein
MKMSFDRSLHELEMYTKSNSQITQAHAGAVDAMRRDKQAQLAAQQGATDQAAEAQAEGSPVKDGQSSGQEQ